MLRCKIVDFLFFIIPLKRWRDFLIRRHFQKCPVCQDKVASSEEVKSLLINEGKVGELLELWPAVEKELKEGKRKERFPMRRRLKWAYGAASLLAAAAAVIWLYFAITPDSGPSKETLVERFQINYIKIGNKPARAYLFRPHDSKMIIVWAEKNI